MSVAGRYIAPRSLMTLGTELLWLLASSVALVTVNDLLHDDPPAALAVLNQAAVLTAMYLLTFYLMDLYDLDLVTPQRLLVLNLTQAVGLLFIAIGVLELGTRMLRLEPTLVFLHLSLTAVFVFGERKLIDRFVMANRPLVQIGVIGSDDVEQSLVGESARRHYLGFGFNRVGGTPAEAGRWLDRMPSRASAGRLVIEEKCLDDPEASRFLQECRRRGMEVEELSTFYERAFGKVLLGPRLLRELALAPHSTFSKAAQSARRLRDTLLAALGLLVTLPLSVIVALAIKLDSAGPVLFTQDRVGKNGRLFRMIKFRSMFQDAKPMEYRTWTTHKGDPRVTRVGAVIRKLHLDELPQLINVIRGDMSLVGPRPFHPSQAAQLDATLPYFKLRLLALPGLTGWAQVRCDYAASIESQEEVLARDLYYIKRMSLLFDLLILVETVRTVLWRRGAR